MKGEMNLILSSQLVLNLKIYISSKFKNLYLNLDSGINNNKVFLYGTL